MTAQGGAAEMEAIVMATGAAGFVVAIAQATIP